MLPILARDYHDHNAALNSAMTCIQHGPPLVFFDGDEEGGRSTVVCAFDPGVNTSPKLLLSTLLVVSWFPP